MSRNIGSQQLELEQYMPRCPLCVSLTRREWVCMCVCLVDGPVTVIEVVIIDWPLFNRRLLDIESSPLACWLGEVGSLRRVTQSQDIGPYWDSSVGQTRTKIVIRWIDASDMQLS